MIECKCGSKVLQRRMRYVTVYTPVHLDTALKVATVVTRKSNWVGDDKVAAEYFCQKCGYELSKKEVAKILDEYAIREAR